MTELKIKIETMRMNVLQRTPGCLLRLLFLLSSSGLISCYEEQEILVTTDFDYALQSDGYTVPVQLIINNNTTGADFYRWTFEGASPSSSGKKQPGAITYSNAGTYTISLEAWNDTQRDTKTITLQLDSAVTLNFDAIVQINDFATATVEIRNKTKGASTYTWTFEGGTPETSASAQPPLIAFTTPGDHLISLTVTNGREAFTTSKTITLKPALRGAFEIVPSFEDEDYEAPLMATLKNLTENGLHYTWSSTGGTITNATSERTSIFFRTPGNYIVTLQADNAKETQTIHHTIHVKPNTNLYVMRDVKLGIVGAHTSIGSFYALKTRKVIRKDELIVANEHAIDLVFFGINSSFGYCRFISPDSAAKFGFPDIPHASHTYIINTQETSSVVFTETDFDAMVSDAPLTGLNIRLNDTKISFFNGSQAPRILLFETADGRKGAIKIKSFIADGLESYILADIKVQKLPGDATP
jgi:PKD repeat protein